MNKAAITLALLVITSIGYANPKGFIVDVMCPNPMSAENALTNYGTYLGGFGVEAFRNIESQPIYFKSTASLSTGVPSNLSHYVNELATYDSTTGQVTCSYRSSLQYQDDISVSYTLTNGKGAAVLESSPSVVSLKLLVGNK